MGPFDLPPGNYSESDYNFIGRYLKDQLSHEERESYEQKLAIDTQLANTIKIFRQFFMVLEKDGTPEHKALIADFSNFYYLDQIEYYVNEKMTTKEKREFELKILDNPILERNMKLREIIIKEFGKKQVERIRDLIKKQFLGDLTEEEEKTLHIENPRNPDYKFNILAEKAWLTIEKEVVSKELEKKLSISEISDLAFPYLEDPKIQSSLEWEHMLRQQLQKKEYDELFLNLRHNLPASVTKLVLTELIKIELIKIESETGKNYQESLYKTVSQYLQVTIKETVGLIEKSMNLPEEEKMKGPYEEATQKIATFFIDDSFPEIMVLKEMLKLIQSDAVYNKIICTIIIDRVQEFLSKNDIEALFYYKYRQFYHGNPLSTLLEKLLEHFLDFPNIKDQNIIMSMKRAYYRAKNDDIVSLVQIRKLGLKKNR